MTIFPEQEKSYELDAKKSMYLPRNGKKYRFELEDPDSLVFLEDDKKRYIGDKTTFQLIKKINSISSSLNWKPKEGEDSLKTLVNFLTILGHDAYTILVLTGLKLINHNIRNLIDEEGKLEYDSLTNLNYSMRLNSPIIRYFIPKLMKTDKLDVTISDLRDPKITIVLNSGYYKINKFKLLDQYPIPLISIKNLFTQKYLYQIYLENLLNIASDNILRIINGNKEIIKEHDSFTFEMGECINFKNYFTDTFNAINVKYTIFYDKSKLNKSKLIITMNHCSKENEFVLYHQRFINIEDNTLSKFDDLKDSGVVNYYIW